MMNLVAEGVWAHESEFCQSNAVVVRGRDGVLLVDPGVRDADMACLADDLAGMGLAVAVGFSTHPHWDHLLWHPTFGAAPRYGTARCAATVAEELSNPDAKADVIAHLEGTGIEDQLSLEEYGLITALPDGAAYLTWDGPRARIIEHQAHAPGHAALFLDERGVLVAGDMLSDVLVPMLNLYGPADPVGDYLAALSLIEDVAARVDVVIPGHGSVAEGARIRERIERDRAYVLALREGKTPDDPRIGPSARPGWEWVSDVHHGQLQGLAQRGEHEAAPR